MRSQPTKKPALQDDCSSKTGAFEMKLSDFAVYYKPCEKCGYDTAKSTDKAKARCWRCGNRVYRDFSDRALLKNQHCKLIAVPDGGEK